MPNCTCTHPHARKRIVLTGGPGAGKTAVLELISKSFCEHVKVLPEAAGILFSGGFPRGRSLTEQKAVQRAIFHVQRQLEAFAENGGTSAILLCDRGTVDGAAYWPEEGTFWESLGIVREEELSRYDAVIHLRTPRADQGYNHRNPVRVESEREAQMLDQKLFEVWDGHPRRYIVDNAESFIDKAQEAIAHLRSELPVCCKEHLTSHVASRVEPIVVPANEQNLDRLSPEVLRSPS